MTIGIVLFVGYMVSIFYVIGFSLFQGVTSSTCMDANLTCPDEFTVPSPECVGQGENCTATKSLCLSELAQGCPGTYVCDTACYELEKYTTGKSQFEHIDKCVGPLLHRTLM